MVCCSILHNLLLGQSADKVDRLLAMLQREGMAPADDEDPIQERPPEDDPVLDKVHGEHKRGKLAAFLVQDRV